LDNFATAFVVNDSEKVRIDTSGNVGIGTTSPRYQLDLAEAQNSSQADYIALGVNNGNTAGTGTALGSGLIWKANYAAYTKRSAGIVQIAQGSFFRSALAFYTNGTANSSTDWSERMRIDMDGNVGIGTPSPGSILHMVGVGGGASSQIIEASTITNYIGLKIKQTGDFWIAKDNSTGSAFSTSAYANVLFGSGAHPMAFSTNSIERMRISSAGAIKFNAYNSTNNTGTPTYLLGTDASGNIVKTNTVPGSAAGPYLPLAGGTISGDLKLATTNATSYTSINADANGLYIETAGSTAALSDMRFQARSTGAGNYASIAIKPSNQSILLRTNNTTALTLDASQNATFAGAGSFGGIIDMNSNKITELAPGSNNLDAVNYQQLQDAVAGVLVYQGTWNASTNTPTLASGVGTPGYYYIVSTAGSTNLDGITDWLPGDWAIFSDQATDVWQKIDHTNVLNGAGTGNKVTKWSGSGTSYTLTDSILEDNGSELVSAGKIILNNVAGDRKIQFNRTGGNSYSIEQDSASLYFYNTSTSEAPLLFQNDGDVIMNAGNVGIGTSSPSAQLHLQNGSTEDVSGSTIRMDLSGINPYWEVQARNGGTSATRQLGFYTSATSGDVLTLTQAGNVGIGTTSPSEKLTVDAQSADGVTTTIASFHSNEGESGDTAIQLAVRRSDSLGSDRKTFLNATGAGNFEIQRSGSTKVTIEGGGNVGIGTTSPGSKLSIRATTASHELVSINRANSDTAALYLGNDTGDNAIIAVNNGELRIGKDVSGTFSEYVRIDDSGNVGIGTTSPTTRLNPIVAANTDQMVLGTASGGFKVGNTTGNEYGINMGVSNSGASWIQVGRTDGTATAYDLSLQASGGNVGIGTTTPDYKLDVAGDVGINNYVVHNGDTDTFIGFSAANTFDVNAGGVKQLSVTSDLVTIKDQLQFEVPTASAQYNGERAGFGLTTGLSTLTDHGKVVYLAYNGSTSPLWALADNNVSLPRATNMIGIFTPDGDVLIRGFVRNSTWNFSDWGAPLYLGASGAMTQSAPAGNGDYVRIVGYSTDPGNNTIYFCPDNTWVKITA
jgi:hypothetical protein